MGENRCRRRDVVGVILEDIRKRHTRIHRNPIIVADIETCDSVDGRNREGEFVLVDDLLDAEIGRHQCLPSILRRLFCGIYGQLRAVTLNPAGEFLGGIRTDTKGTRIPSDYRIDRRERKLNAHNPTAEAVALNLSLPSFAANRTGETAITNKKDDSEPSGTMSDPHERDRTMAKEKDDEEEQEGKDEAEQAREEELEDETEVEQKQAREDAATDEQNKDNHRDEEPFQS